MLNTWSSGALISPLGHVDPDYKTSISYIFQGKCLLITRFEACFCNKVFLGIRKFTNTWNVANKQPAVYPETKYMYQRGT